MGIFVMMKKSSVEQNQIRIQEYSGLTLAELEKKLITEKPESLFECFARVIKHWGRLLCALIAVVILVYGASYVLGLRQEINDLRRDLDAQTDGASQAENAVQNQPFKTTPPGIADLPVQSANNNSGGEPLAQPGGNSQLEDTGDIQPVEVIPPVIPVAAPSSGFFVYTVHKGDSLAKISTIYYKKEGYATNLAELNGIPDGNILFEGQEIRVPVKPYDSWVD
jgi:hypothetical protein